MPHFPPLPKHAYTWLAVLLLAMLAGCAQKELAVSLPVQDPPPFAPSGDALVPDRWWTTFGDWELNREVERSLGGNFALAAAVSRLRAAEAVAWRESSFLLPDVNGIADASGTYLTNAPNRSSFALGLEASYEVDLWGRIESRVEAEELRASATEADYQAVALTLTAEIARTWYALTEARAQLTLLDGQYATNLNGLKAQELRFGLGFIRSADVFRQRQLVESTREQVIVVQAQIDVLEHRLAVLQGLPPQYARYITGNTLPELPPPPATGLPAELLTRRPDVRRDYLAIWAANRDVASAISARYPRLNLFASVTTAAESPENLFRDWIVVTAGQLIAPLLDGGERRAEVARTSAVLHELVANYGQTVLAAYAEVEDALALERHQRARIESLNKQVDLAREASNQLREQYLIGDAEYLDVLTAITQEQRLQRDILSARLELILIRISLYLSLAGDFNPQPQFPVDGSPANKAPNERAVEELLLTPLGPNRFDGELVPLPPGGFGGGNGANQPNGAEGPAN